MRMIPGCRNCFNCYTTQEQYLDLSNLLVIANVHKLACQWSCCSIINAAGSSYKIAAGQLGFHPAWRPLHTNCCCHRCRDSPWHHPNTTARTLVDRYTATASCYPQMLHMLMDCAHAAPLPTIAAGITDCLCCSWLLQPPSLGQVCRPLIGETQ